MKTIAIDLDDTLNDFTETLRTTSFAYDETFGVSHAAFDAFLARVRGESHDDDELLATEYSFFRAKIHLECFRRAKPRPDGVDFMRWLSRENWRVVICTHRDLRRSYRTTTAWLNEHGIPFDQLFMAGNKIVFCKLWGIETLIDDDVFNITHGKKYGVNVYYPLNAKNRDVPPEGARGFSTFDEVKSWM